MEMRSKPIDHLLSALSATNQKGRRQLRIGQKRQKRNLSSLLRLKAFQGKNFNDDPNYQRGKSTLAVVQQQQFKGLTEEQELRFRQLVGLSPTQPGKRLYLDLDLLGTNEVRAAFHRFQRPFGQLAEQTVKTPKPVKWETKRSSDLHAGTNRYIERRLERMFRSNTISREVLMRMSESSLTSPNFLNSRHP